MQRTSALLHKASVRHSSFIAFLCFVLNIFMIFFFFFYSIKNSCHIFLWTLCEYLLWIYFIYLKSIYFTCVQQDKLFILYKTFHFIMILKFFLDSISVSVVLCLCSRYSKIPEKHSRKLIDKRNKKECTNRNTHKDLHARVQ